MAHRGDGSLTLAVQPALLQHSVELVFYDGSALQYNRTRMRQFEWRRSHQTDEERLSPGPQCARSLIRQPPRLAPVCSLCIRCVGRREGERQTERETDTERPLRVTCSCHFFFGCSYCDPSHPCHGMRVFSCWLMHACQSQLLPVSRPDAVTCGQCSTTPGTGCTTDSRRARQSCLRVSESA